MQTFRVDIMWYSYMIKTMIRYEKNIPLAPTFKKSDDFFYSDALTIHDKWKQLARTCTNNFQKIVFHFLPNCCLSRKFGSPGTRTSKLAATYWVKVISLPLQHSFNAGINHIVKSLYSCISCTSSNAIGWNS